MDDGVLIFDVFRLDTSDSCLWRDQERLRLTPKAFAVLRYQVEHAGQLVTKEDLFQAAWPETVVSDAALTVCIRELRQVLGDDAKTPQYIETVHRRGFRFIGKVVSSQHSVASSSSFHLTSSTQPLAPTLVGRETELSQLHYWLEKALRGERQLVFVTGEAGIGKTTIVDVLVEQVRTSSEVWVGQGQCIEQFGAGEPYLPLLSAFGQLGREPGHARVVEILSQYAPTWLVQMPALVPPAEVDLLLRKTAGATRERMLRELAEALEVLTAGQPLLLVLEDLHWSDPSTLEFLSFLARRRQPAQLLVLGTYRPVEVLANGHPLRAVTQELQLHQYCQEMPLRLLNA